MFLNSTAQPDKFIHFWHTFEHPTISKLSDSQEIQLQFISSKLQQYHTVAQQHWTNNNNVRMLIEMTELLVQESLTPAQTQLKEKIIQIFQNFNLNIFFNDQNLIELSTDLTINQKPSTFYKKPFKFHHKSASSDNILSNAILRPKKIKGANRTRKKLEKEWNERRAAEKKLTQKFSKNLSLEKSLTPADLMAQTIWDHEMQRHMKILSENKEEFTDTEFHEEW